jgi:hypothetical protein
MVQLDRNLTVAAAAGRDEEFSYALLLLLALL